MLESSQPLSELKTLLLILEESEQYVQGLRSDRTVIAQIMPVGGTTYTQQRPHVSLC